MAIPPPAMTITVDIPILTDIFQSVRNLEAEVRNLRTDFSTRLELLEKQLANQSAPDPTTSPAQDIADDTTLASGNFGNQEEDRVYEDDLIQEDDLTHENIITPEDGITPEEDADTTNDSDLAQEDEGEDGAEDNLMHQDGHQITVSIASSPSIDEGITAVAKPMASLPAAGKKRKRTEGDARASGFLIRGSDIQLAQRRSEGIKGPSRSESPFDNDDRHEPSSDEIIPPTAPPPALSQSQARPRYRESQKSKEAGLDAFVAPKPEDFTISQYTGRIRVQTKRPAGFIATPDFEEDTRKPRHKKQK